MTPAGGNTPRSSAASAGSASASAGSRGGSFASATDESLVGFFASLGRMKTRSIGVVMAAFVALGAASLPVAPTPLAFRLAAVSIAAMTTALAAFVFLGRELERGRLAPSARTERLRLAYHVAWIVMLVAAPPITFILDVNGPVDGLLGLAFLVFAMDASARWSILATLVVAIPHLVLIGLVSSGAITARGSLDTVPSFIGDWFGIGSAALVFGLSYGLARIYRRRTSAQLDELAEAGREVAARDVLLREARAELEQALAIGARGRFTEQTLGSFVLGPIIGFGGMGEVYEGTHRSTQARAAVKLLRPSESGEITDAFRRFEREAALVGKLESPNIVRLLEVGGMEAAFPYMAMERLEGTPLDKILEKETWLSPARVADLVTQVARGLSTANVHDVVHRDIKPSNLFLADDGVWKILDFGLGRIASESASLTGNGLVGTLGYLAPEQLVGEGRVCHQTDVHALGIVAYRALTGHHVFVERDAAHVMREVESRLPRRPSEVSAVPAAVDDVLRIALAKDPADRFSDAADFAAAFRDAIEGRISPALAERSAALGRRLDWASPVGEAAPRRPVRGGRKREPTVTVSAPPPPTPEETNTRTAPPQPKSRSLPAPAASLPVPPPSTPSAAPSATKLSLVDVPEDLMRSLWIAPARGVTIAFAATTAYSLSQVPLGPHPELHWFGYLAVFLLFASLLTVIRLARDNSETGARRFRLATIGVFLVANGYLYFFGPTNDVASFIALGLMLFVSGVSTAIGVTALLVVALPHSAMLVIFALGQAQDAGFYVVRAGVYGRLLLVAQVATLYALAFGAGVMFKNNVRRTLVELSAAFRANAEREALLRDARLALERAVGIGQPGRFSGKRLGRFLLGPTLGRGGMGEVYEGSDVETGERAAVKVLTRSFGEGDAIARFDAEARAIASLSSKNVVAVLAVGTDVVPYIAMERLFGFDLAAILQKSLFLPPRDVAEMLTQIAGGLEAAHAKGIVHADITPRNLFRTDDGTWKLLDFGVALTGTGASEGGRPAGTPGYVAPEQLAHGTEVDHRVDIHALAICAYRALTGRPAFAGRDAATTLYRVLHDMPLRPSAAVDVSKLVDDVLRIALAKDPADRFDEAATFAKAFAAAVAGVQDERITKRAERLNQKAPWAARRAGPTR